MVTRGEAVSIKPFFFFFFHEFFCSGRNPHPGQLGEGRGVTAGKPVQFLSRFNRQPGVILAKFCEQQLDLRAPGAHRAPADELHDRRAGVS